jgi:hypothetical protein
VLVHARALVSSILTSAHIAELRTLCDTAATGVQFVSGKWRPAYDKLYAFIGCNADPVAGVDHNDNRIILPGAAFGTLRIWRDLDQNGVAVAGELQLMIRRAA